MIQTTALSPSLGVEVTGLDSLDDDTVVAQLLEALKWRGVLLVRGLNLDDDAQLAFSRKLGKVVTPAPGQEIFTVSLDPAKT
ncbi:MAG: TauD/TfdA dioxygenase family protein, partial [Ruminiclostridium sp.]